MPIIFFLPHCSAHRVPRRRLSVAPTDHIARKNLGRSLPNFIGWNGWMDGRTFVNENALDAA